MVPDLCAFSGCSIFIASRTTTRSPSLTSWPSSTATLTMVPCIGEARVSPEAAGPDFLAARRLGLAPAARPVRASDMPSETGRETSRRLPPTSTTTVSRPGSSSVSVSAGAANGLISLTNSVSIQRVWTVNGSVEPVSSGANAGSVTTARWNGMAVAMPSTWNSSRARAARCRACARVAPVTISLASSESQAGPMTEPDSTPASRRTPGPDGAANVVTVPGAGRKPRPGSSPLMRNSNE
ncbi:hypothetical protein SALBM311S_11469 [Streptomyces alboniger]